MQTQIKESTSQYILFKFILKSWLTYRGSEEIIPPPQKGSSPGPTLKRQDTEIHCHYCSTTTTKTTTTNPPPLQKKWLSLSFQTSNIPFASSANISGEVFNFFELRTERYNQAQLQLMKFKSQICTYNIRELSKFLTTHLKEVCHSYLVRGVYCALHQSICADFTYISPLYLQDGKISTIIALINSSYIVQLRLKGVRTTTRELKKKERKKAS